MPTAARTSDRISAAIAAQLDSSRPARLAAELALGDHPRFRTPSPLCQTAGSRRRHQPHSGETHDALGRRADGPHRRHQDRQGHHLRHAAGSPAARALRCSTSSRATWPCATAQPWARHRRADRARRSRRLVHPGRGAMARPARTGRGADAQGSAGRCAVHLRHHGAGSRPARRRAGGQRSAVTARLQREAVRPAVSAVHGADPGGARSGRTAPLRRASMARWC